MKTSLLQHVLFLCPWLSTLVNQLNTLSPCNTHSPPPKKKSMKLIKPLIDCWVKRDQLHVTCFIISLFNAQHVSDVNTSILRSLRLICWVISWVVLIWFNVCWCYIVVWLWWCGIHVVVWYRKLCFSLHTDTTPPQPNHNVTPTHIEPDQYNPWNNSTNKSQAPEDGCINIRNMLSIK